MFSLGVLLREIVTGKSYLRRGELLEEPHLDPRQCPAQIAALIHACSSNEPERRPTAQQVVQGIERSIGQ